MTALAHLHQLAVQVAGRRLASDLCGTIRAGDAIALTGANGAGKSTLLRTLAGEHAPASGQVDHSSLSRDDIAYLPQAPGVDLTVPLRAVDLVAMGLWRELGAWRKPDSAQRARIASALDAVGLAGKAKARLETLSGGELQRLLLARLDLTGARLFLLDEPFAALDEAGVACAAAMIARWRSRGGAVIAAVHEVAHLAFFDRRLHLEDGRAEWLAAGPAADPGNADPAADFYNVVALPMRTPGPGVAGRARGGG
jgi:zinc/manganese transport system ATP-binding protein